jgi:hypothetical protein
MQVNELIGKYLTIRDKKDQIKAEYDAKVSAIEEALTKIENALLRTLQNTGMESVRTDFGTAYISVRNSCTTADKQAFLDYIRSHDDWGLLDARPMKSAVEQYQEEHGDIPPGLNWRSEQVLRIRRSA